MKKYLNVVLATTRAGGIGLNNTLPWHLKGDLKHFANITKNYNLDKSERENGYKNAIVMGRKTFESQGDKFPLPQREHIVLSKNGSTHLKEAQSSKDLTVFDNEDQLFNYLSESKKIKEVFLIGGSDLLQKVLTDHRDIVKNVFLTRVYKEFECDTFMPKDWLQGFELKEVSKTMSEKDANYDFTRYINPSLAATNYDELCKTQFINSRHEEYQYLELIEKVIKTGSYKEDRTGTGVVSLFGNMMRYDLEKSFPMLTTKRVFWKGVVEELLWFLRGETDGKTLSEKGVRIWDGNGSREFLDKSGFKDRDVGDLGPVYGFQWRHFGAEYKDCYTDYTGQGIDQIQNVIDTIKSNPTSRRLIVCSWNVSALSKMALPPCHVIFQFFVADGKLSCLLYQRSCDVGLGVPFNIASYAQLNCMIADMCGLKRGEFIHMLGDTHIYSNHIEPLKKQIKRQPNPFPILNIKAIRDNIADYKMEDFELVGYHPQKTIKMDMAV